MRNDLIFAVALTLAGIVACLCLAPRAAPPKPSAEVAAAELPEEADAPAFDAPLSDLVATMPPEPQRPRADATVRVKLAPSLACPPDALYCPAPASATDDVNQPLLLAK